MGSTPPPLSHDDYTVGWICALALEMAAAVAILDERHSNLPQSSSDHNNYQPGRIGEHNVIIACLPAGVTGTTSAATVAAQMLSTFKFIRFGLMVGIGGGVPSKERDIRLGDMVISEPTSTFGGVVQYDFGKTIQEGRFIHTGSLDKPPAVLLTAVAKLKAIHMMEGNKLTRTISEMWTKYPKMGVNFVHQGAQHDRLFEADYDHAGTTASCEQCDAARLLDRPVRSLDQPRIYYGLIASGNQVMNHGVTRDRLSREFGILCFETEAAGLMNNFPCLVIRGICDYADSHKSKRWQEYAAAVAAAYAKELLYVIPKAQVVNVSLATQTAVYSRDFNSSGVPTVLGSTFTSGGGGDIDMEKVVGLTINSKAAAQPDYTGHYSNSSLRPVSNYVQRPALHQQLKAQLHDRITETKSSTTILVVRGLGGAGKSQLVLNYLQEYRNDYSATFWIEAGQRESVDRDFLQIYKLLYGLRALEGQEMIKPEDAVLAVKSWFQRRSGRWLVVFDSADAIDDEEDKSYIDLRYFLPDAASVTVIITTRSAITTEMTELEEVNVAEMEPSEAAELFIRCAKLTNDSQAGTEVELIVKELGYLALAITLAGSYVSMTPRLSSDLKQFLPEYCQRRKALLSQKPKRLTHQYGESVLGTWEMSFSAIKRQSLEASRLLTLLAFLHFDDIFQDLFIQAMGSQETARGKDNAGTELIWRSFISPGNSLDIYAIEAAFRCLQSFSLIQWKPNQSSYTMHKLVHAWGYDRLNQDQQIFLSLTALQLLRHIVSNPKPDPAYKIRLVPHLMANFTILSSLYNEMDREYAALLTVLDGIGDFLSSTGHWIEEFPIRNFCLNNLTRLRGEEHPDTLWAMRNLANSFGDLGKLDEAASMQREVLEKLRRIFGKEHPSTIAAMNDLAVALGDQGKLDEAASMHKEVLEKRRRILGEEHLDTISAINNLAVTLRAQGKPDEAASMLKDVLEKWRKILGNEHPDTLGAMGNLATTLGSQGKLDEAASMLKEVLERERKILGNEHHDTISAMSNLAVTLRGQGKLEEAASMRKEVLEKRRKILGKEHPAIITAMNNLANSLRDQGELDEAASMQREVLEMRRRTLGEEHPDTISAMNNLAAILEDRGELEEAASMKKDVLEKRRRILGEKHPDTITAINDLATTLGD